MLTALQRAAVQLDFTAPDTHVSREGTITFRTKRDGPRRTERDPAFLTQLALVGAATVAKIAGLDRAQHLDALRRRQVSEEMVEHVANHWDSLDAYHEQSVFELALEYAQEDAASTGDSGKT